MSQAKQPFKNFDDYTRSAPKEAQAALQTLRQAITAAAPKAEESITYGMPTFTFNGPHHRVHIAGWKKHVAFYGASETALAMLEKDLAVYKTPKGTLQFPLDQPLPLTAMRKLIKLMVKEARGTA
jgi:uncharacterized protein YdhG (YjbR/CyaY superfamily)